MKLSYIQIRLVVRAASRLQPDWSGLSDRESLLAFYAYPPASDLKYLIARPQSLNDSTDYSGFRSTGIPNSTPGRAHAEIGLFYVKLN